MRVMRGICRGKWRYGILCCLITSVSLLCSLPILIMIMH